MQGFSPCESIFHLGQTVKKHEDLSEIQMLGSKAAPFASCCLPGDRFHFPVSKPPSSSSAAGHATVCEDAGQNQEHGKISLHMWVLVNSSYSAYLQYFNY